MKSGATQSRHVTVVGAGVIGITLAAVLQARGHQVRVLDPRGPGGAASRGHSGGIAVGWVSPQGLPGTTRRAVRWVLDPAGPVVIRPSYLPRLIPWLLRLQRESRRTRVEAIADALAALTATTYEDWVPLLVAVEREGDVRHTGALTVYRSREARDADSVGWELRRARGYEVRYVEAPEIRELEPALAPNLVCGVYEPDGRYVRDPLQVVQATAQRLVANGGDMLTEYVSGFHTAGVHVRSVVTDQGEHEVDALVIAGGAWSHRLSAALGDPVPLESERGYSATLPEPGVELTHVVGIAANKMTLTPMATGLRVAGTAEFSGVDAPATWERAEQLLRHGRAVLPGLRTTGASRWAGDRPILPDSLPVLGPATRFDNTYYAFGHSHIGFTLAGATARIMADVIEGRSPGLDLQPFRVDRFARGWPGGHR